jgi:hypothetical protein
MGKCFILAVLCLFIGFFIAMPKTAETKTATSAPVAETATIDFSKLGIGSCFDHCTVYSMRSGAFLIVARDDEKYATARNDEFADGLKGLEADGYKVVMRLPQESLPPYAIAVWATKK